MPLSDEQREIVDLVTSGKNVFFTGCAGAETCASSCFNALVFNI